MRLQGKRFLPGTRFGRRPITAKRPIHRPSRREAAYSPDLPGRGARGEMTVLLFFFQVAAATV
jgi:hypothetical protein